MHATSAACVHQGTRGVLPMHALDAHALGCTCSSAAASGCTPLGACVHLGVHCHLCVALGVCSWVWDALIWETQALRRPRACSSTGTPNYVSGLCVPCTCWDAMLLGIRCACLSGLHAPVRHTHTGIRTLLGIRCALLSGLCSPVRHVHARDARALLNMRCARLVGVRSSVHVSRCTCAYSSTHAPL